MKKLDNLGRKIDG